MSWTTALAKANAQIDDCVLLATKYVLPWWGATMHEFGTPIFGGVHALYAAHECAKKYRLDGKIVFAPARHVLTNYPEASICNLTCRKGDDEVGRWNVQPYHVRSHLWAAQQAFWEGKAWVEPLLAKYGFVPFDQLAVYDQLSLLLLPRAVGIGCTKGLLRKAGDAVRRLPKEHTYRILPVSRAELWLQRPNADTTPFDGSQTTEVVRLRFAWCTRIVLRQGELGLGDLPLSLKPPVARPPDLVPMPKDFRANMKAYSNRARREGPTPTGPWPVTP
jgi:hypothetical protein